MTENPGAAVPSEPTTPDPTPLTNPVPDDVRAALKRVLGQEFPGVDRTCDLLSYLHAKELIAWRVEVGPSPEQIDAAANAVREWTDDVATDDEPRLHQIMRAALVAARSVRGTPEIADSARDSEAERTTSEVEPR